MAETGIAWPVDLDRRFGPQNAANLNSVPALRGGAEVTGPLRASEHLAVWMRTGALPAFRKLWGRVLQDLPAGALVTVSIANRRALAACGASGQRQACGAAWPAECLCRLQPTLCTICNATG